FLLPQPLEKLLQQRPALFLEDSPDHLDAMVQAPFLWNIEDRAAGAALGIPDPEDHALDAGQDGRADAHRARLHRHVQRAADQPPGAQVRRRLADRDQLGVGRRVLPDLPPVVRAGDHAPVGNQDRRRLRDVSSMHYQTAHFADFLTFFFDALVHAKLVAPRPGLTIYGPRGTRRLFGTLLKVIPGFSRTPFPITITELVDRTIRIG